MADLVPYLGGVAGFASLGWNIYSAYNQAKLKNYENEFKIIEGLINDLSKAGSAYWIAAVRDTAAEISIKLQFDDLDSKLASLQSKGIIRDKNVDLVMLLIDMRRAVTSTPFETAAWAPDPFRLVSVRRTSTELLHQFLIRR